MIKAIGFDLGDTLIQYKDVPLSWENFYEEALISVLVELNISPCHKIIEIGKNILSRYNTRTNPREYEIDAYSIFKELFKAWDIADVKQLDLAISTFFTYFQRKKVVFNDVTKNIIALGNRGVKTGILTDVPYGMTTEFVMKDIYELGDHFDYILTSVEVGYRKPNITGYTLLAKKLNVLPTEMIYVGNEKKDIIGANLCCMKSIFIDREKSGRDFGQDYTIEALDELCKLL